MDNLQQVAQILDRAGYILRDCQVGFLCIVDPTCVWPPLLNFIRVAWIILTFITGMLLAGWGITMLRGANHAIINNLRTLVLIFGTLSVAIPAMNLLGGGKAIVNQCDTMKISQAQVNELLKMRSQYLQQQNFEHFEIRDSDFDDLDSEFNF